MAAPSFVSQTAFATGTGALTVAACASVVSGDLILLFVESANETVATPSGFTLHGSVATGSAGAAGGTALWVFYRIASGADSTTSVADSGNHTVAIKVAYRGVYTTTPIAGHSQNIWGSAASPLAATSFDTQRINSTAVFVVALDRDAASATPVSSSAGGSLSDWTLRAQNIISGGAGGGLAFGDGTLASIGNTGSPSFTLATASIAVGRVLVLNEAPPASSNTASAALVETGPDLWAADASAPMPISAQDTAFPYGTVNSATTYDTSFPVMGTEILTAKALNSGSVNLIGYWPFMHVTGGGGATLGAYSKWQYRPQGSPTWLDAATEIFCDTPSIGPSTQIGICSNNLTLSGLTVNSTYEFRFNARKELAAPTGALTCNLTFITSAGQFPLAKVISNVSGLLDSAELGSDTFTSTATVTEGSGDTIATVDATESTFDTLAADANVIGSGVGHIDAVETGPDTIYVDIEPRIISTASVSVAESGSDTAEIKADEYYKSFLALHEVDVYGAGTSEQTQGAGSVNTLEYTSLRLDQHHGSLLNHPGTGGVTNVQSFMMVGWKYRKVGDPSWIVMTIGAGADTERFSSLGEWDIVEGSLLSMITSFSGEPYCVLTGLLKNTEYEVVPTLRFDTSIHPLPPAGTKAWADDPFYLPYNPELVSYVNIERLHGPLAMVLTEPGADTLVADAEVSGIVSIATINAAESAVKDSFVADADNVAQAALSATESGADSCASSAGSLSQAAINATESGADTIEATAFAQAAAIATIDATESGSDTATVVASVTCQASLTAAEVGADTTSLSAQVFVAGLVSASEAGADTASVSSVTLAQAAIAAQESAGDTVAVSTKAIATASMAAIESGADALAGTAAAIATAALAATEEGADAASAGANVLIQASMGATEIGADTAEADATVTPLATASISAVEVGSDAFEATADVIPINTATIAGFEEGADSVDAYANAIIQSAMAGIESGADSFTGGVNVVAAAILASIEAGQDSAAAMASVIIQAIMDAVESGSDGFEGSIGTVPHTDAYLQADEIGRDVFYGLAGVLDVDLHVQIANCRKTIFTAPSAPFVVLSGLPPVQINRRTSSGLVVPRATAVTAIDDDCA